MRSSYRHRLSNQVMRRQGAREFRRAQARKQDWLLHLPNVRPFDCGKRRVPLVKLVYRKLSGPRTASEIRSSVRNSNVLGNWKRTAVRGASSLGRSGSRPCRQPLRDAHRQGEPIWFACIPSGGTENAAVGSAMPRRSRLEADRHGWGETTRDGRADESEVNV